MRRLFACLALAAAATIGAAMAADDPEVPEVPPVEPETPPPAAQPPVVVEVERDEETRAIQFFIEATAWFNQPVGGDYVFATEINPASPFITKTHSVHFDTSSPTRWRAGVGFKDDIGALVFTYWGQTVDEPVSLLYPGKFIIGETLVYPLYAGFENNGLADGATLSSTTATRDSRFDFVRDAFKTKRLSTKWLAGLRFVDHSQTTEAGYHVLAPDIPPLMNDQGEIQSDLIPRGDQAFRISKFSGRGIEAGFEGRYEIVPKLHLEGGFVFAMLRGKTDATYASTTNFYTFFDPNDENQEEFLLSPADYDLAFGDPAFYTILNQRSFSIGIQESGSSTSSNVLEVNLGFRLQVWRGLEVVGGLRQARYDDIVLDLRPTDPALTVDGVVNVQGIEKESRSVAYEGYYLGVAFTF